jgi:lipopolysaccharide export system protein LptA
VQAKGGGPTALQGEHRSNKKSEKDLGQSSPIAISAMKLTYADADRKAHYEGGVSAKGTGFTATAREMDVYLQPRSAALKQPAGSQSLSAPGKLDHMVAQGDVIIQQPGRRAEGQTLIYTASDDRFVITGGPPSIFDAEHGKITGDSLTFFRSDDRVLVEGGGSTPVVTQTRVTR